MLCYLCYVCIYVCVIVIADNKNTPGTRINKKKIQIKKEIYECIYRGCLEYNVVVFFHVMIWCCQPLLLLSRLDNLEARRHSRKQGFFSWPAWHGKKRRICRHTARSALQFEEIAHFEISLKRQGILKSLIWALTTVFRKTTILQISR